MHNEETFKNLEASLAAFKQITDDQRSGIPSVQHERDLLADGHMEGMEKCEELEALLKASNDSETSIAPHQICGNVKNQ